jgi:pimeloyl-ACP methyl ester carboxylesterase
MARPDIAVHILPATGHFSMLEKPLAVARLIRDFCAGAENKAHGDLGRG